MAADKDAVGLSRLDRVHTCLNLALTSFVSILMNSVIFNSVRVMFKAHTRMHAHPNENVHETTDTYMFLYTHK